MILSPESPGREHVGASFCVQVDNTPKMDVFIYILDSYLTRAQV